MAPGSRPDLLAEHVSRPAAPVGPGAVTLRHHVPRPGGTAEETAGPRDVRLPGLVRALRPELVPGAYTGPATQAA
jgi:hypothetical protein